MSDNLQIIQRLLEIGKNPLVISLVPKDFKEEHIFLANILNYALTNMEREFNENFKKAVAQYKGSLKEEKGYGWFHNPENLVYENMYINQLKYIIYGERFVSTIKFKEELGKKAYLDLINQIDRTALMTPAQLKKHNAACNRIANDILKEILAEEKKKKSETKG